MTVPVELTPAIEVLLLAHVPPLSASLRLVNAVLHTLATPKIPGTELATVTVVVVVQPPDKVYVIVADPVAPVVTLPEEDPMLTAVGLVLVHVPPPDASENTVEAPRHKLVAPLIAGTLLKVTVLVTEHIPPMV